MFKLILKIIGVLILGALGALVFNLFLLPYMLASPYFENFQFVKNFKQGKIVVNQEKNIYIQENTAIEDAILRLKNSVVAIQSGANISSGLIATSDGTIVTLANAIAANGNFKVFLQEELVKFKIVKIDNKNNLALIKIEKNNLQTVGFANINKIKLGQRVFLVAQTSIKSINTAQGGQNNWLANEGIIREINVSSIKTNISESAPVKGSPLFNSAGELVGLNFIDQAGKISAVPVSKIQELLGL